MNCPHCTSPNPKEQHQKTSLGYQTFRCSGCRRTFNERTGTPFNFLEYPTDIVLLVVLWRLRYKLSLRDLAEMFLERLRHVSGEREYFGEGCWKALSAPDLPLPTG
jgi:putative transposase